MTPVALSQFEKLLGTNPWLLYNFLVLLQNKQNTTSIVIRLSDIRTALSQYRNTCNSNLYRWLKRLKETNLIQYTASQRSKKDRGYGVFTVTPVHRVPGHDIVWVPDNVVDALKNLTASPNPKPSHNSKKPFLRPAKYSSPSWETSTYCGNIIASSGVLKRSLGHGPWLLYKYLAGLRLNSSCKRSRVMYILVSHIVEKSKLSRENVNITPRNLQNWLRTLKDAKLIQEVNPPPNLAEKYKNISKRLHGWYQVYGRKDGQGMWLVPPETHEWIKNKSLHGGYRPGAFGRKDEPLEIDDLILPGVGHPQPYLH